LKQTFKVKAKNGFINKNGLLQPPKKSIVDMQLIESILPYSAKKNNAKEIAEYSTLYPATSSASASGKSNGVLLVSAREHITKSTQNGNRGTMNQTPMDCSLTTSWIDIDPEAIITLI